MGASKYRLNDEQRKLVEQNYSLVQKFAHNYKRLAASSAVLSFDDIMSIASIGLCKAAYCFDPTLGYAFSTYAYAVMRGCVMTEFRKVYRTRNSDGSYSPIFIQNVDPHIMSVTLIDPTAQTTEEIAEQDIRIEAVRDAIDKLNPMFREPLQRWCNHETQKEIAANTGYSQANTSRRLKTARENVRNILTHKGWIE